jgi:hypothetical protein
MGSGVEQELVGVSHEAIPGPDAAYVPATSDGRPHRSEVGGSTGLDEHRASLGGWS